MDRLSGLWGLNFAPGMGEMQSFHNPLHEASKVGKGKHPPTRGLTSRCLKRTLLQLTRPLWTSPPPLGFFSDCMPCSFLPLPLCFLPPLAHAKPAPASELLLSQVPDTGTPPHFLWFFLKSYLINARPSGATIHLFYHASLPFISLSLALKCFYSIYPYLKYCAFF